MPTLLYQDQLPLSQNNIKHQQIQTGTKGALSRMYFIAALITQKSYLIKAVAVEAVLASTTP
jgi:hypothetical protein